MRLSGRGREKIGREAIKTEDFIRLERVSKIYGSGSAKICALDALTLNIARGEFVAVLGASGCGKSTLMNIIGALDRPDSGRYYFEGENILRYNDRRMSHYRNKVIGFIFQGFNLDSSLTALENVMLPLVYGGVKRERRAALARAALERVGLGERMNHRPPQLSGGQMQRVCIARALAGSPKIILADEPTGNLDRASGERVMDILTELWRAGYTVIMVTHNNRQALRAARIIEIADGRLLRDERTAQTSESDCNEAKGVVK